MQFPKAREKTGAERLYFAFLLAKAKLNGEPIAGGQLFNILVRGAQAGEANLLGEAGKAWVSKQRRMAKELVANVRLGCVHGL